MFNLDIMLLQIHTTRLVLVTETRLELDHVLELLIMILIAVLHLLHEEIQHLIEHGGMPTLQLGDPIYHDLGPSYLPLKEPILEAILFNLLLIQGGLLGDRVASHNNLHREVKLPPSRETRCHTREPLRNVLLLEPLYLA